MSKHTPGPWNFEIQEEGEFLYAPKIKFSMRLNWDGDAYKIEGQEDRRAEAIANARLIAAAPDLLAALELAYFDLRTIAAASTPRSSEEIRATRNADMIRAAIDKAKGESELARAAREERAAEKMIGELDVLAEYSAAKGE